MSQTGFLSHSVAMLQKALGCLQGGNPAGAEEILAALLKTYPNDANALHMLGVARLEQHRPSEALEALRHSIRINPRHALTHLNFAKALSLTGSLDEAIGAFRQALTLKPDLTEAHLELGRTLHRTGQLDQAEKAFRAVLKQTPALAEARAALGAVLIDLERDEEAELVLARALTPNADAGLAATLHHYLGLARRGQGNDAGALESFDTAQALAPDLVQLDQYRADALQNLDRNDEALATLAAMLARAPQNPDIHYQYNSLLYRMGRDGEFLDSFKHVRNTPEMLVAKAQIMIRTRQGEGALDAFIALAALDPANAEALSGQGIALSMLDRHDEARAAIQAALKLAPDNPAFLSHLAGARIRAGDPQEAAAAAMQAAELDPLDQTSVAMLATAWRMMDDPRDEALSGYNELVRVFDLEPPKGWPDMESFNAELAAFLDEKHPSTRNYFDQTQRGGTKTAGNLFDAAYPLVAKLRTRIEESVARYIRDMKGDAGHPLLRRRTGDFRFSGSWSSRLKDCGFHVDHIHPRGWISSCYYAAVPDAVRDETEKQGWIKFGQPAVETGTSLPMRRAVQPQPGRLVLFPSYMWHGTIPFRSRNARTTIAFDVLPD